MLFFKRQIPKPKYAEQPCPVWWLMIGHCLGIGAWDLGIYEEFLARETGTVGLLVDGFCQRRRHDLDRGAQLCRPEQSASHVQERSGPFLSQRRRQGRRRNRESDARGIWRCDRKRRRLERGRSCAGEKAAATGHGRDQSQVRAEEYRAGA